MLDRVIDAPAHQGRTYLDQALAQAVWEGKLKPSPGLYDQSSSVFFDGSRCLQSIEGCGLLANSQSCHPLTTWGSAMTVQSLWLCLCKGANQMHAQLVIW